MLFDCIELARDVRRNLKVLLAMVNLVSTLLLLSKYLSFKFVTEGPNSTIG